MGLAHVKIKFLESSKFQCSFYIDELYGICFRYLDGCFLISREHNNNIRKISSKNISRFLNFIGNQKLNEFVLKRSFEKTPFCLISVIYFCLFYEETVKKISEILKI